MLLSVRVDIDEEYLGMVVRSGVGLLLSLMCIEKYFWVCLFGIYVYVFVFGNYKSFIGSLYCFYLLIFLDFLLFYFYFLDFCLKVFIFVFVFEVLD